MASSSLTALFFLPLLRPPRVQRPISRRDDRQPPADDPSRRAHTATGRRQQSLDVGTVLGGDGGDRRRMSHIQPSTCGDIDVPTVSSPRPPLQLQADNDDDRQEVRERNVTPAGSGQVEGAREGRRESGQSRRHVIDDLLTADDTMSRDAPTTTTTTVSNTTLGLNSSSSNSNSGHQHHPPHFHRRWPERTENFVQKSDPSRHHHHSHHHLVGQADVSPLTVVAGSGGIAAINRSKSDVQDFLNVGGGGEGSSAAGESAPPNSRRKGLTSSLVKRSRSFHKLFTTSMLSRTKEYNFQ